MNILEYLWYSFLYEVRETFKVHDPKGKLEKELRNAEQAQRRYDLRFPKRHRDEHMTMSEFDFRYDFKTQIRGK